MKKIRVERKKGPKLVQRVIGNKVFVFPVKENTFEIEVNVLPLVEQYMEMEKKVNKTKEVTNGKNG